jgi:hypothetical protein
MHTHAHTHHGTVVSHLMRTTTCGMRAPPYCWWPRPARAASRKRCESSARSAAGARGDPAPPPPQTHTHTYNNNNNNKPVSAVSTQDTTLTSVRRHPPAPRGLCRTHPPNTSICVSVDPSPAGSVDMHVVVRELIGICVFVNVCGYGYGCMCASYSPRCGPLAAHCRA